MKSNFVDSMKLVLSDSYNIPDSSYKRLSGILLNSGLSEDTFDSGIVQLIHVMMKNKLTFPISISLLKSFWNMEGVAFNFVHTLSPLVVDGVIKLKKVKRDKFIKSDAIMKGNDEYDDDKDFYVVVYATEKFDSIYNGFEDILSKEKISEGAVIGGGVPKKLKNILDKTAKLLNEFSIDIKEESYLNDDVTGIAKINLILSNTSEYTCKDNVIQRTAKKFIGKLDCVTGVESYADSETELFLNLDLKIKEKINQDLAYAITSFVKELEVNYAK